VLDNVRGRPIWAESVSSAQSRRGVTGVLHGKRLLFFVLAAVLIGLAGRFYLIMTYVGNYDYYSYDIVAGIVSRGGNIYVETNRYNYSPVWAFILLGLGRIMDRIHVPYHVVIRTFLTIVDLIDAAIIGYLASRTSPGRGWISFAAYLANPVTILLTGYHGQFENLAMLPVLTATALMTRPRSHTPGVLIWILATCSILIKQLSIFSVWMLYVYAFKGRRAVLAMIVSLVVFAGSFLPYLPAGADGVVHNVLLYQSAVGVYGFGLLPRVAEWLMHHGPTLSAGLPALLESASAYLIVPFGAFMGLLPFFAKGRWGRTLPEGMRLSAVGLLTSLYGYGEQYFIIPVIFGSYSLSIPYVVYSLVAGMMILNNPVNVALFGGWTLYPLLIVSNLVWLAVFGWFIYDIRATRTAETASEISW